MANKPGEANFFPDVPVYPEMGTFQPVYGKFDLTTYIQGASDYEIMAFLVGKYNACLEAYGTVTKLSTETVQAAHQLQDWINNWFDNLDVQEELNKKIDDMVADGSFGTLLHQTFDTQINQQTTNAVTQWLVANVTPTGSAVVVDKSLSIEGAAADAKAVGTNSQLYRNSFFMSEPWILSDYRELGTYGFSYTVKPTDADSKMPDSGNLLVINERGYGGGGGIKQTVYEYSGYTNYRILTTGGSEMHTWYESAQGYTYNGDYAFLDNETWKLSDYREIGTYGFSYTVKPTDAPSAMPASGNLLVINERGYGGGGGIKQTVYEYSGYTNYRILTTGGSEMHTWYGSATNDKKDKKIALCGDSFIAGGAANEMQYYLNQYDGFNASTLATGGISAQQWWNKWGSAVNNDYDIFLIALGLNDNEEAGLPTDYPNTTTTYSAAINYIISNITSINPTARIILWGMDAWFKESYANALYAIAKNKGIECYCMKSEKNIPIRLEGKYTSVFPNLDANYAQLKTNAYHVSDTDGHPNEAGRKLLAEYWTTIL